MRGCAWVIVLVRLIVVADGRLLMFGSIALLEVKIILCDLVKNFEFTTTEDQLETRWSTVLQPYAVGKREEGPQVMLQVKAL